MGRIPTCRNETEGLRSKIRRSGLHSVKNQESDMRGVIKVATCQFAIGANIKRNTSMVRRQILQAKRGGADVVHFPECAMSGYGGADIKSWRDMNWRLLQEQTQEICKLAKAKKVWVILGSSHQLSGNRRPHNSLYVINPLGKIIDRYDKRFCTKGDLKHYSPGDHFVTFNINGVKCGLLICYDVRFPELYREYKKLGVQLMFHSFYNARMDGPGIHSIIMSKSAQVRAATNYMWVSANNASGYYQSWSSELIEPHGVVAAKLKRNVAGVMVNKVDTRKYYYDASKPYRKGAMKGVLNSGKVVSDARSRDRKSL